MKEQWISNRVHDKTGNSIYFEMISVIITISEMKFNEQLETYMTGYGISGKELAEVTNISPSLISRYRKGDRTPTPESGQIERLASGLSTIAKVKKGMDLPADEVLRKLTASITMQQQPDISNQLNELIIALGINVSKMAQSLHYDASYISKVRQGKRKPADRDRFCSDIIGYIAEHYSSESSRAILVELTKCEAEQISKKEDLINALTIWFHTKREEQTPKKDYIDRFLEKMDEFDLQEYISAIQFDKLKVPTVPFQLPSSKHYFGLEEMREGEIDFLKAVVLSKSMEPLMLCSDMPVEDMAEDKEFAKKYMFGLAMVLRKGLQIQIIHNVDRPMEDMVLGMENWIPLYMTGQIVPRYLKGTQNEIYNHLHYCAGSVSMTSECISGCHESGHYYRTNNKDEVRWTKRYMEDLFHKSDSLMDIYTEEQEEKLKLFLQKDRERPGERRRILNGPPFFTLSQERFEAILERNKLGTDTKAEIMNVFISYKENMEEVLKENTVCDAFAVLNEEEYQKHPAYVAFPGNFLKHTIRLSYEEYLDCIECAQVYETGNPNYHLHIHKNKGFQNIQITIREGKWCMISKGKSPMIHFVVRHPKLRYAFENMWIPIVEEEGEKDGR